MKGNAVRGRLVRGLCATALSPVVTTAIQLGTVPVLLASWGTARYADWLLLSAVPGYLAVSDLGFGDAATSDMTVRVASGDRKGAVRTFQSACLLLAATSFSIGLLSCLAVLWTPWQRLLNLSTVSDPEACAVMILLIFHVAISQQMRVLEGGFRCDGRFAAGIVSVNILRLVEALVTTAAALLTRSLAAVACTGVVVRLLGTWSYWMLLRAGTPWLVSGVRHARWQTVRELFSPAMGFIALPAGQAISLQGFTLLIGTAIGPTAVVAFSTLRTLTRTNVQVLTAVARTLWPELSRAFGSGDVPLARMLHRSACQAALCLSAIGGAALWALGPYLYRIWMGTAVAFDAGCFHVLLAVAAAHSVWYTSSVVPISTNRHQQIAWAYLGATALSFGFAWYLVRPLGITGAAISLLFIDVSLCWLVLRTALRHVGDTFREFLPALGRIPQLRRAES